MANLELSCRRLHGQRVKYSVMGFGEVELQQMDAVSASDYERNCCQRDSLAGLEIIIGKRAKVAKIAN